MELLDHLMDGNDLQWLAFLIGVPAAIGAQVSHTRRKRHRETIKAIEGTRDGSLR